MEKTPGEVRMFENMRKVGVFCDRGREKKTGSGVEDPYLPLALLWNWYKVKWEVEGKR